MIQQEYINRLETENAELKEKINQARILVCKIARETSLKKSRLPKEARARLRGAFENSTDNAGWDKALASEQNKNRWVL